MKCVACGVGQLTSARGTFSYKASGLAEQDRYAEGVDQVWQAVGQRAWDDHETFVRRRGGSCDGARSGRSTLANRRFPASAHDADALATETALARARGGCPAAQALLAELERRHPAHRSAARLRAACPRGR